MSGIYLIRNLINGRCYVGQSRNIRHRFAGHKWSSRWKRGYSIGRAIAKYGLHNFSFEVLEECSHNELFAREKFWIAFLKPAYNRNPGGQGNSHPHSDKTKRRLSLLGKLQWSKKTEEEKQAFVSNNLKGPRIGHPVSGESRKRMSEAHRGKQQPWKWKSVIRTLVGHSGITAIFPSITSAAKETRIHQSLISMAIHCRIRTAGGFIWKLAI